MHPYMRIWWERFKIKPLFYLLPYLVFFIFIIGIILIFSITPLKGIDLSTIVAIILFLQAIFIFIQLFIVNQQKNYAKIAYLPRMIVKVSGHIDSSTFTISISNLGEVAYNLVYRIIIKESTSPRKILDITKVNKKTIHNGKIYFIERSKEHLLRYFSKDEFVRNEIIIDAIFEDIFHLPHRIRFIKLPNETGFRMVSSGI